MPTSQLVTAAMKQSRLAPSPPPTHRISTSFLLFLPLSVAGSRALTAALHPSLSPARSSGHINNTLNTLIALIPFGKLTE